MGKERERTTNPTGRLSRKGAVLRLGFIALACATLATPSSRRKATVPWIERGLRPALFDGTRPLSESFENYLATYFPPDPRLSAPRPPYPIVRETHAKNCIVMIGDGMGLAEACAASLAAYGVGGRLSFERMPIVGLVGTQSASSLVPDSGAAGTALASGVKTYNGAVNTDPAGRPVEPLFITAKRHGKRIGLVVTSSITHATPATFAANVPWRTMEDEIAVQLVERGINVLFGGGLSFFLPRSHPSGVSLRRDERNLLAEAIARDYEVCLDPDHLTSATGERVLGLFALGPMPSADKARPSLADMTRKALDLLSRGDEGFCLMVEGSQIDWRGHMNDFEGLLWETLEFDRAVACCLDFAARNGQTLVIVTADHETGGLGLSGKGNAGLSARWTTHYHTAIRVPLWAYGPGCLKFAGVYENTEVPKKIAEILDLADFPGLRPRAAGGYLTDFSQRSRAARFEEGTGVAPKTRN